MLSGYEIPHLLSVVNVSILRSTYTITSAAGNRRKNERLSQFDGPHLSSSCCSGNMLYPVLLFRVCFHDFFQNFKLRGEMKFQIGIEFADEKLFHFLCNQVIRPWILVGSS